MKKVIFVTVLLLCAVFVAVGANTMAETKSGWKVIQEGERFNITLPDLTKGEDLAWDWQTENSAKLHFWIENKTDHVEYEVENNSSDKNDMTIPEDGSYEIWWENLYPVGSGNFEVNVSYKIDVINHAPKASITATPNTGKEPLTVKFQGSGQDDDGTIESYEWDFKDGEKSNQKNPDHTFTQDGSYEVTLTVTDNDGKKGTATVTIKVRANNPPVAVAKADVTGGEPPLTVTFDGSDSDDLDGNIVSYVWDFGDGETDTGVGPTHIFDEEGTYVVTLNVTDDDDASDEATVTITVSIDNVPPEASAAADKTEVTEGATVTFTGGGTDGDGTIEYYSWDFGDGGTSTNQNPTHTYEEPGEYTVVLTVTDDDDATATATLTITVKVDSDGDGYSDDEDEFPEDSTEWADNDGDGTGDNADEDDDNDGMPDTYEAIYPGLDPKVNDADKDADGDGATNLEEFKEGTNPVDVGSKPTAEKDEPILSGSTLIILVVIIILVVVLLMMLMRKGGGAPKGAPPSEPTGGGEPPVEYGDGSPEGEPGEDAGMEEVEPEVETPEERPEEGMGEETPAEEPSDELDDLLEEEPEQ